MTRTRDAKRLVNALEQHLSIPVSAPEGHLILELSAGVDADGHAFLLPRIGGEVARFDRRLREVGATLLDGPVAVVDVTSGELVVGEPTVRLEPQVRNALLDEVGTTSDEGTIPPGRYEIDRMLVEDSERSSAARQLAWFLGALAEPTDARSALRVRDLLVRLRCVAVAMRDVSTVVAAARTMAK